MTLFKPTLKINRLVIFQGGHTVYDEKFHDGVNVIRGRNSSGKTTIMDFLAFSLGAENIRWKTPALECTDSLVEVELNGKIATFRREVSDENQRPLFIFWGAFEEANSSGNHLWERYSFKRSQHQLSFSQVIFGALDMPIAQGDGASNLTLHQLLRVLYADQPSVHSPIFRSDPFDSPLTREMIGGYLSGVYDDELYSSQLRLREVTSLLGRFESELRGIFNVLGRSGQSPDLVFSNDKVNELEYAREQISAKMAELKVTRSLSKEAEKLAQSKTDLLRQELNSAKKRESDYIDEFSENELDIGDSLLFVRELEERLSSLDQSKATRTYFGNLTFQFCPCCLGNLDGRPNIDGQCHLCTAPLGEDEANSQILRMGNELRIQLKESAHLIEERRQRSTFLRQEIPLAREAVRRKEVEYKASAASWSSEIETTFEDMSRKLGALDEEIKQAYEHQKLASVISDLQKRRDALTLEVKQLEEKIHLAELKQENKKNEVAKTIEAIMLRLLKLDLPLQKEFIEGRVAAFSFVDNLVTINGSKNFSESSAVVLRHIFHLALLTASMEKSYMRVPRFLMLDGIDDGGMEKDRSHRLQKIIVDECATYKSDFQLIYATSEINPDFESTDLVVGRAFSPLSRSLNVR